jgi:hypothetical protein
MLSEESRFSYLRYAHFVIKKPVSRKDSYAGAILHEAYQIP